VTTLETRETARPLAGGRPEGRVVLFTGGTRGAGTPIARSLARKLGPAEPARWVARVVLVLCADACSSITVMVLALDGSQEL
jgi:hypothetical protein